MYLSPSHFNARLDAQEAEWPPQAVTCVAVIVVEIITTFLSFQEAIVMSMQRQLAPVTCLVLSQALVFMK